MQELAAKDYKSYSVRMKSKKAAKIGSAICYGKINEYLDFAYLIQSMTVRTFFIIILNDANKFSIVKRNAHCSCVLNEVGDSS